MSEILSRIVDGVAALAPTVAGLLLPGSGPLVHQLMRAAAGKGDEVPIADVAAAIGGDPRLMVELQRLAMDHEARLAEVEARKLESVNATMRQESKSEHWPQYSWRPFNGFSFPLAVVMIYFVLPIVGKAVPDVPEWVWMGWLAILGVATYDRGKEKRVRAGEQRKGVVAGMIEAIRGM